MSVFKNTCFGILLKQFQNVIFQTITIFKTMLKFKKSIKSKQNMLTILVTTELVLPDPPKVFDYDPFNSFALTPQVLITFQTLHQLLTPAEF